MSLDKEIRDLFAQHGIPLGPNDVWKVQGNPVIYHKNLERLAGKLGVRFDAPNVIRAERDEAVILVGGCIGDRWEWSIGEAVINVNYSVTGRQKAYVYAMAEKRAKDRVILKLAGLHGAYSEDEADEFRDSRPASAPPVQIDPDHPLGKPQERAPQDALGLLPSPDTLPAEMQKMISDLQVRRSIDAVTDFMNSPATKKALEGLATDAERQIIREYAKARLVTLGWQPKKAA